MLNDLELQTFLEATKFYLNKNGLGREVSVLEKAELEFEYIDEDWGVSRFHMNPRLTPMEYLEFQEHEDNLEKNILAASNIFLKDQQGAALVTVRISPKLAGPVRKVTLSGPERSTIDAQIADAKAILISVATGGPKINSVNNRYQLLSKQIQSTLKPLGIDTSKIYVDLWAWYSVWSTQFKTYQERRDHISSIFKEIEVALSTLGEDNFNDVDETGWAKVDRGIREIKTRFRQANTEEQLNAVGVLCRETLINVAQVIFDPELHSKYSDVPPSPTDSKRMIDCFFAHELGEKENENLRRFAKDANMLANELTHRRSISRRDAAICVNATFATINIIFSFSSTRERDLF